jgi:Gas vesicle protein G
MLFNLLASPVTGLTWIAEQVHDRVMEEFDQKSVLSQQLLALQMAFDLGQVDEAVFDQKEEELLLALQAIDDEERALDQI